jgi:preprotein translocase subunit YajC
MIIRPQSKKAKEREKMLGAVQKGDKIVTTSGIHGTVSSVEETTVIVLVADNMKLKFDKSAIASVINPKTGEQTSVQAK